MRQLWFQALEMLRRSTSEIAWTTSTAPGTWDGPLLRGYNQQQKKYWTHLNVLMKNQQVCRLFDSISMHAGIMPGARIPRCMFQWGSWSAGRWRFIQVRFLPNLVKNWEDVNNKLNGTEYAHFLDGADYVKWCILMWVSGSICIWGCSRHRIDSFVQMS